MPLQNLLIGVVNFAARAANILIVPASNARTTPQEPSEGSLNARHGTRHAANRLKSMTTDRYMRTRQLNLQKLTDMVIQNYWTPSQPRIIRGQTLCSLNLYLAREGVRKPLTDIQADWCEVEKTELDGGLDIEDKEWDIYPGEEEEIAAALKEDQHFLERISNRRRCPLTRSELFGWVDKALKFIKF
ncbi:hypothetical protein BDW59DRAFT_166532 [Aspergillus cavernicola]|uniref:Uncharacterized protein n=1 Tax=Aspergillus cavernicola TaxID=176166 RepID=A0ABR4HKQ5_9EURO